MAGKRKRESSVKKVQKEVQKEVNEVDASVRKGKPCVSNVKALVDKEVRIEHRCHTRYIVQANGLLTTSHQARIKGTPFSWCLSLQEELNINCALLREVLHRWVPNGDFIRIRQHLVELSPVDVAICLGLSGSGVDVTFDSDLCGEVGLLFTNKEINIKDIIEKLSVLVGEHNEVESVCRLYVMLCFVVLYFLRTSRTVTNMPFKVLDNLDNLHQYRWASFVHNFLISSLNRSSKVLREKINEHTIFVAESVDVVQVWAARTLALGEVMGGLLFPCFLSWPVLRMRGDKIKKCFECNEVVLDWGLALEEMNIGILQEEPRLVKNNGKKQLM